MPILDTADLDGPFQKARTAMRPLWDSFDEYERIARNKPHPKVIQAKLPTVTDGTLAGVIASQPKRVVQAIPTGRIKVVDMPEFGEVASFVWEHDIIPHANTNGDMIQKSWVMLHKALTYGMQFSYAFFKQDGDYFGADFSIPYIRDLVLQRGKVFGPDCKVLWLRQYYTREDIQAIIDKETKLTKSANKRKDKYESNWNLDRLKLILNLEKAKDPESATPNERDKQPATPFIEIIHGFEEGINSKFISFSPQLDKGDQDVRTKVNPDPSGKMPIKFLYADVDLSNPLGRGYPEISGGMQNLVDSEVQSYQLAQKLGLNPPVMKWGDSVRGSTIKWKPNAVWDMGNNPQSKIEIVDLNSEAIKNFVNNYSLMKSQILNLTHDNQSGVSGSTSPNQSKTDKGVKQQMQTVGFDDNYLRKQYEAWFQDNAESMLNIHFAESSGTRDVELTEDFIKDITPVAEQTDEMKDSQELPGQPQDASQQAGAVNAAPMQPQRVEGPFQKGPATIDPEKQQATIVWDDIKSNRVHFTVDATSSELPDDETQVERLQTLLSEAGSNPYLYYYMLNDGYQLNLGEAYRQLFMRLGVEEIDKIVSKLPNDGSATPEQLRGVMNPLYDKPKVDIRYPDLPPAGQIQAAMNAGITLTPADVMAGPVVDPNIRGVEQPIVDPNAQLPIPGPYSQNAGGQAPDQPGYAPGGGNVLSSPKTAITHPVTGQALHPDTGHIIPAQPGEAASGPLPAHESVPMGTQQPTPPSAMDAQPGQKPPATQPTSQAAQMPQPAQQPQLEAQPSQPQPASPEPSGPLSPEDQAVAKELLAAGYSTQQVAHAIIMVNSGRSEQEILQALGPPLGGG